ncbi:GTP cyclohydrolase 1 type 2 [invertebrate metagenome]|uniref:GTP cyclohydrolase 1 type 2 n=1 Tax=invertebrate metagenome TaxID=1711999 RepID=A0A2H9TC59_9ZZZZ
MGITLNALMNLLNHELKPELFKDYCPNGLQVEGKPSIKRIVTGVTACQQLIDEAIRLNADALLVHHGYFWRGENQAITGMKQRRIRSLLNHGISLITYHLPLDAHPTMGNNAQLAHLMGWETQGGMEPDKKHSIGNWGTLPAPISLDILCIQLEKILNRKPLIIDGGEHPVHSLAWCTGAAQSMIQQALDLGVDAFISGEISESTVHFARENNIHYISAGHHATERYGVQALGQWLEKETGITCPFVDINSPV